MTDDDLEGMHIHQRSSAYHDCVTYFCLKEVRLRAIEKKFGMFNPSKETYKNCIEELDGDNSE